MGQSASTRDGPKDAKMLEERWVQIPGYESYEVSDCGRIRSLDRTIVLKNGHRRHYNERILSPSIINGVKVVTICCDNQRFLRQVHSLVMLSFIGESPKNYVVKFKDGNKLNTSFENLEYTKRVFCGERCYNTKLTHDSVVFIKDSIKSGITRKELAHELGVCFSTIDHVSTEMSWKETIKCKPQIRPTYMDYQPVLESDDWLDGEPLLWRDINGSSK